MPVSAARSRKRVGAVPLARPRSRASRIIDHSAIYLLIAGTYTPFVLVPLHGNCTFFYAATHFPWKLPDRVTSTVVQLQACRWPAAGRTVR